MLVYVSFSREYSTRTSLWHEPLEEENVGLGALHEVTSDSYKTWHGQLNDDCRSHVSKKQMEW